MAGTTLAANGMDHNSFGVATGLTATADIVISDNGTPMLLPSSMLRGLFAPGQNIAISTSGTISSTAQPAGSGTALGSAIGTLQVVSRLATQDLVPVSQSGSDRSITYANFLNGVTVDQLPAAGAVSDNDIVLAGQSGTSVLTQTFLSIWSWIASKLPVYKRPVVEISSSTSLNSSAHNGRILICSQALTLTPSISGMGSGFHCTAINASTANVTLGTGFLTSSGSMTLGPWQSAAIFCAAYSGGTIAFASLSATASP